MASSHLDQAADTQMATAPLATNQSKRQAVIIGATGLVGKYLLNELIAIYDYVIVIARTCPAQMSVNMECYELSDFGQLAHTIQNLKLGRHTDAFTCLGSTKKQAGSKSGFRQIDFEYNLAFAKACHEQGVGRFFLLSALGADAGSRFFYNQVKGELEEAIIDLGFKQLSIFQPSLLLGKHKGRPAERLAQTAFKLMSPIVPKSLPARPISARRVAGAMVMQAEKLHARRNYFQYDKDDEHKVSIIRNQDMLKMTDTHKR